MATCNQDARLWAAWLVVLEYVAFFGFVAWNFPLRPSEEARKLISSSFRHVRPDGSLWPDPRLRRSDNLLSQSARWAMFHAITFLALFYACRTLIIRKAGNCQNAMARYSLLLLASLPYLWLLVACGWNSAGMSDPACWVCTPVALLFVPTVCFQVINAGPPRSAAYLAMMTAIELLVLLPLWVVIWFFVGLGMGLYWPYPPL
jgi:hypothetical protein